MTCDWAPLRAALAACRHERVDVPLWWRDDDAVAPTPALDRLATLSERTGLPVHLAIIPAHVDATLAHSMDPARFIPVVHGWAHHNHSTGADKKNEYLTPRDGAVAETGAALAKMTSVFGNRLRPMFVPPWNRISDEMVQTLAAQGYTSLSTFGPRHHRQAATGLSQINTHIDPIWWSGTRDLVPADQLILQASRHITARARGNEDKDEPLGLLTHHLVHTDDIWDFSVAFIQEMLEGGAAPWAMENDR